MFLGCGSEWTVPGLLSHDFFPSNPGTPRQIPDPAKTEAEGAVLVRRRDSEEGGCRWEPHIGRLVLNYLKNNKQMQITYTIN